jgi:opacity protein-like surface antigen
MEGQIRYDTQYEREFCRVQPYGGVGLGIFFADLSTNVNSVSDNAVPGFNALGGVRLYITEHIAVFGEYKYNYAVFDASTSGQLGGIGFKADYHANHVVGGLSIHF